jgi:hypothetical protein
VGHFFTEKDEVDVSALRNETLELLPRHMAPGYYDVSYIAQSRVFDSVHAHSQ